MASYCHHCGEKIQPQESKYEKRLLPRFKLNFWIFFAVLLAAPFFTSLVAFLGKGHVNEQGSPIIALFGGIACGIACGIMLALRIGRTIEGRVALGIVLSVVFVVVCVLLSFFGCTMAGYQVRFG
jgi:lipopolysaccharide export LptBFGC system permease protein LptF